MSPGRPPAPISAGLAVAFVASAFVLLSVMADAVGLGVGAATTWTIACAVLVAGAAVVVARRRAFALRLHAPRKRTVAYAVATLCVGGAAVVITSRSADDLRRGQHYVAFSALSAGAGQVRLQITNRDADPATYLVQVGRGSFLDVAAARTKLAPGATTTRSIPIPAGRGILRFSLRAGDRSGPLLRRVTLDAP